MRRKNLEADMRYTIIADVLQSADVVIVPYFDMRQLVKTTQRRSRSVMRDLNHSLFRSRLITSVEKQGKV